MKPNIILLVDADPDICAATLAAARSLRFDIRYAQIRRGLSEIAECGLDDVAVIVLDVDPDVHGTAISEALQEWQPPRPIILISSVESAQHPVMLHHGSARYLSKPVSIERLAEAIKAVARAPQPHSLRCDRWGHLIEDCESSCQNPKTEKLVAAK